MFSASADLYDLIYSAFKDYGTEAAVLAQLIRTTSPKAVRVLDVACGTGEHARVLTEQHGFHVDGLDLDPAFVRIAQAKLPNGSVHVADMTSFAVPDRYDVILCLFSSIGYVRTLDRVQRTLETFRDHLAPGGVVIIEPWFEPGQMEAGRVFAKQAESADVAVCRMSHLTIEGSLSRLQFEYLIGRAQGIERASEVHELGLFSRVEMLAVFRVAGLEAEYEPEGPSGRGIYVARTA